ncbi:MAG: XRE family transcriptional regulator [Nocardioides sp.]|uniref:helix-turn-helix domain-containing protein n=1 Tax=Nocardioides sp. TaxID=35761 RepID=UPI0039E5C8C1
MSAPMSQQEPGADAASESAVHAAVAANVRRARLTRGLSLRDLAELTGLSKGFLSQIERERANPALSVVVKLGEALDLTFAELTRIVPTEPEIVRSASTGGVKARARMLFAELERRRFDLSEGYLPPHTVGVPSDHGRGSVEYAYVVDGHLTLTVGDQDYPLGPGDTVRFSSALAHAYSTAAEAATLLSVVCYVDE